MSNTGKWNDMLQIIWVKEVSIKNCNEIIFQKIHWKWKYRHEKFLDTAKAVLREIFITLNECVKKEQKYQVSKLSSLEPTKGYQKIKLRQA